MASNEIEDILSDPNLDEDTRAQAKRVASLEKSLETVGIDPGEADQRPSLFMSLLDTLDAPRQGIAGIFDTIASDELFSTDPITGENIGIGFRRGQKENTTFSDILRKHDLIDNPVARGVVGFAGDIISDPLSWLSFGTAGAGKVGVSALTKEGLALADTGAARLIKTGLDPLTTSEKLDTAFRGLEKFEGILDKLKETTDPTIRMALESQAKQARGMFQDIFKPEDIATAPIFEKDKLRVGINLPGQVEKKPIEKILEDPGPVGQAMRDLQDKLGVGFKELASFDIAPQIQNAVDNISLYAAEKLSKIDNALKDIPVLNVAPDVAKATGQILGKTYNGIKKIFNQAALTGKNANDARLQYISFVAGAKEVAARKLYEGLGEDILQNKALQKEIAIAVDSLATNSIKNSDLIQGNEKLLENINRLIKEGDLSDTASEQVSALVKNSNAEPLFRQELSNFLSNPKIPQELRVGVEKTIRALDQTFLEELNAGIQNNFISAYLPHKYKTFNSTNRTQSGKAVDSFTKERKYNTIGDAFKENGNIAETDLGELLYSRVFNSMKLQAQKKYFSRLALEEGLPISVVKSLYNEALIEPGGEAAKMLRANKINFVPLTEEQKRLISQGVSDSRKQEIYKEAASSPDKIMREIGPDFEQKVHEELWAAGAKPLDNLIPKGHLGELGEEIAIPGRKEPIFLPKPIADSYKETIAAKDYLKSALGDTPIGKASIDAMDAGTSFVKKIVTLPFPAYWTMNYLGDRFRNLMEGAHSYQPGIFARAYDVLGGKTALKTRYGYINTDTLKRIINQTGIKYTTDDYLGTIKAFGDSSVDKILANKSSILENVKGGQFGVALKQTQDKLTKSFDGFYRVSHLVHRLEQGDSIENAAKAARDVYFDYRNMSPVEQSLFRRFYMFYGYMSNATKSALTDLVTNPGRITTQLHGSRALMEFFSQPDAAPDPDQLDQELLSNTTRAEQLNYFLGETPEGKPIFGKASFAPISQVLSQFAIKQPRNVSVGELINTAFDSTQRTIQKQFASSNPFINFSAQAVSGKNLYFDKPLSSEFLRTLPSLNAVAERIAGLRYDELPVDLDAPAKAFLNAVPNGRGGLIADKNKMFILMNIIPGLSRANSMLNTLSNEQIPANLGVIRSLFGINMDAGDVSRSFLSTRRENLEKLYREQSVGARKRQLEEENNG